MISKTSSNILFRGPKSKSPKDQVIDQDESTLPQLIPDSDPDGEPIMRTAAKANAFEKWFLLPLFLNLTEQAMAVMLASFDKKNRGRIADRLRTWSFPDGWEVASGCSGTGSSLVLMFVLAVEIQVNFVMQAIA